MQTKRVIICEIFILIKQKNKNKKQVVSHASFGKKIVAVDDRVSTKETKEFIEVLHEFVFRMSRLMGSSPIWKYVSTKKWREFVNTTDRFIKWKHNSKFFLHFISC